MNYEYALKPIWKTRTSISLIVKFVDHDSEVPFIAHSDDTDEYNRELFTRAAAGEFGPINNARLDIFDTVWKRIQEIRDTKIHTGGCKVGEYWYHSDTHSKVQQLSLIIAGNNLPAGIMWKTMSGEKVEMTPELATSIYYAQMTQEQTIYGYAEYLKAQCEALEYPEHFDIENNWPEVYA
jgi:hypothetical protein